MPSAATTTGVREVLIPVAGVRLAGTLALPPNPVGIVLFAHGSGSSRFSPRNQFVASALRKGSLGTLLLDLLTQDEEAIDEFNHEFRFDVDRLAHRLAGVSDWLRSAADTRSLPMGCFGASTGGGAALVLAAARPEHVKAVVSRGGRPDLAGTALAQVRAPTLLIVGGEDPIVIDLNRRAMAQLRGVVRLDIVSGATHLFQEAGALEQVAQLATSWFLDYLK